MWNVVSLMCAEVALTLERLTMKPIRLTRAPYVPADGPRFDVVRCGGARFVDVWAFGLVVSVQVGSP